MSDAAPEGQPPVEAPAEEPEVEYAQIPVAEWEQIQQTLQQVAPLAEYVQQLPAEQPQQPEQQQAPAEWDPFDPNALEQVRNIVREEMAPVSDYTQQQQLAEMSERAMDILNDYAKEQGYEFLNDESAERALILANHYVAEETERYGMGTEAAEKAIARAADDVHAWEESVGKAYNESQMNQVRQVTGAPQQPQTAGAQAAQSLTPPVGGPREVFLKHFGVPPTGI